MNERKSIEKISIHLLSSFSRNFINIFSCLIQSSVRRRFEDTASGLFTLFAEELLVVAFFFGKSQFFLPFVFSDCSGSFLRKVDEMKINWRRYSNWSNFEVAKYLLVQIQQKTQMHLYECVVLRWALLSQLLSELHIQLCFIKHIIVSLEHLQSLNSRKNTFSNLRPFYPHLTKFCHTQ